VRVSDNSKGETLDGQGDGHGLRTMQVRAEDLGGRVDCRVLAEGGFVVELTLPAA
jgi:signal transduction histidine kinase